VCKRACTAQEQVLMCVIEALQIQRSRLTADINSAERPCSAARVQAGMHGAGAVLSRVIDAFLALNASIS
jgi:hypothetical protein